MTPNTRTRRRAMAAASGLAALALALSACSGDDSVEDSVDSATSAVASAATEATSAVGSAAAEATSAAASAVDDHDHDHDHADDHADADRAYLDEVRAGGVEVHDDADFLIRGHDACRDLEDGESADVVIAKYYEAHSEAPENEGETVVTAAVNAFCPDYAPALNN